MTQTLAQFFGVEGANFREIDVEALMASTAHLIIDAQRYEADPAFPGGRGSAMNDQAAARIAHVKPVFAAAGMCTYVAYYDRTRAGVEHAKGGLHRITVEPGDIPVRKFDDSVVAGSDIDGMGLPKHFQLARIRRVLVSGFKASACVQRSAIDIRTGLRLDVCALSDCLGDAPSYTSPATDSLRWGLSHMEHHGISRATSSEVLAFLESLLEGGSRKDFPQKRTPAPQL